MTQIPRQLSIVLVEDDPGDATLIQYTFKYDHQESELIWVESLTALADALERASRLPDVILLDLSLPDTSGIQTVLTCKQTVGAIPIVVLTGYDDAEFSLQVLEAGAQDYLIKGNIDADSLNRAIRYAMSRAKLEQRLVLSEERMAAAINGGKLGVWDWLFDSQTFIYSDRWLETLGYHRDDADLPTDANAWFMRVHSEDRERIELAIERHVQGENAHYECEFRMQHRSGHWVWVLESGHIVSRDASGKPLRMVGVQQDISARKAMEAELTRLAMHDELTGQLNRRSFMDLAERELARVKRKPGYVTCMVMLDLDRFKSVNDRYGHGAGDAVLKRFADTVSAELRKMDVFGRLGGEEFAVMLPDTDVSGAQVAAEKLRRAVEAMTVRVPSFGEPLKVTTSIGVAVLKSSDILPDSALARADSALYEAKNSGRNQVCINV
ncbi:diguanylate cyclase [Halomonas sp. GD1P12]|uniref:GGDEF domain-containing response regulator n=1 Tax=Halomonas sp. GD1P12 TaxID=2982691 RepID=UPI0021E3A385|nr:diguanylate cyclase [Halomonas sp. GD1P12]UYF99728.1 diguanylate cyclase [Halomonas sp. GD1P12]